MAPFAEKKLAPVRRHNDFSAIRRVLDIGCGPGTNTRNFTHADYLGLDLNAAYIAYARRLYGREFVATDVRSYIPASGVHFDFILANSFFHHIDLAGTRQILSHLATMLTDDGHVHILDLVLPETAGFTRSLARWDRGDYPRDLEEWRGIFLEFFEPVVFEPYPVGLFGLTLWNMIYFKGKGRT
ncbi:MAG: class I SAM-dependent methyltransferase [Thermoplasmata archaeon]